MQVVAASSNCADDFIKLQGESRAVFGCFWKCADQGENTAIHRFNLADFIESCCRRDKEDKDSA